MRQPERENLPPHKNREHAREQAWLESHLTTLWPLADFHFETFGRGAIIINVSAEETLSDVAGEAIRLHYAGQAEIEQEADEVSQRLAEFVRTYDPGREFVAAFIRSNLDISMYQMQVGEKLVHAVQAANLAEGKRDRLETREDFVKAQGSA